MKRLQNLYLSIFCFLAFIYAGFLPKVAFGAAFTQAFTSIQEIANTAGPALKTLFMVCGIFVLGMGIFKWVQSSKREEPKGPALTMIAAGVLLLAIWTFATNLASDAGLSIDASF